MRYIILITILLLPAPLLAEDVYQKPEEFVKEAFDGNPPKPKVFWITKDIRSEVDEIMEHRYPVLRTRYWHKGERTLWVLEEIGKVKPITTGIIINNGEIERLKVLIYRESHGWEVRHGFFTDQFKQAALSEGNRLTKNIDGISGATMSVDALRNLGKLALFFHKQVMSDG